MFKNKKASKKVKCDNFNGKNENILDLVFKNFGMDLNSFLKNIQDVKKFENFMEILEKKASLKKKVFVKSENRQKNESIITDNDLKMTTIKNKEIENYTIINKVDEILKKNKEIEKCNVKNKFVEEKLKETESTIIKNEIDENLNNFNGVIENSNLQEKINIEKIKKEIENCTFNNQNNFIEKINESSIKNDIPNINKSNLQENCNNDSLYLKNEAISKEIIENVSKQYEKTNENTKTKEKDNKTNEKEENLNGFFISLVPKSNIDLLFF